MVLNSLISGNVNAQVDMEDATFGTIVCENIFIADGSKGKMRGVFGLQTDGSTMLQIFGDDGKTPVAYLGGNASVDNEMMFQLFSKSKTDKKAVFMTIGVNGGRLDAFNKLGENVAIIGVGNKGGGMTDLRDKHGYKY